jgi:hypothetical protein
VSRRTHTGGQRQASRDRSRQALARLHPAPVSTRYACPRCGGDHRADEHGVAHLNEFRRLDADELRQLRTDVLEELGAAVVAGAEAAHVERVGLLLAAIDSRLRRI